MTVGSAYLGSMLATAVIVAVIYSAAKDADLSAGGVARKTLGRLGRLLGVLAGLAVIVFILSKI